MTVRTLTSQTAVLLQTLHAHGPCSVEQLLQHREAHGTGTPDRGAWSNNTRTTQRDVNGLIVCGHVVRLTGTIPLRYEITASGIAAMNKKSRADRKKTALQGCEVTPRRTLPVSADTYNGAELRPYCGRPGAMDAFALPSLMAGGQRVYREAA